MKSVTSFALSAIFGATALVALPLTAQADGYGHNNKVVIYFTRHAEKQTVLIDNMDGTFTEQCGTEKCAEELNPLGEKRAELLADWFARKGITGHLTHAFSSHKTRTRQTIAQIAIDAGLSGDYDKNENDGIQEFPVFTDDGETFATELAPESTSPSEEPVINALLNLPAGSVALVAGHSGTIYDIMAGIGLEDACTKNRIAPELLCDEDRYPFNSKMKVRDFGDVWKITLRNGTARFNYRQKLDFGRLIRDNITR